MSENQSNDYDYPSCVQSPYHSSSHMLEDDKEDNQSTASFGVKPVIDLSAMDPLPCLQMLNLAASNPATTSI